MFILREEDWLSRLRFLKWLVLILFIFEMCKTENGHSINSLKIIVPTVLLCFYFPNR